MTDNLMGDNASTMLARASSGEIADWSEDKRKDFVNTFTDRAKAAQWILRATADELLQTARRRQFIGDKHLAQFDRHAYSNNHYYKYHRTYDLEDGGKVGGRPISDLAVIVEERSKLILKELPPLKKAVEIINPDVATKIERKEQILKKLRELKARLDSEDLAGPVRMTDIDPKTTVGDFIKMMETRAKTRRSIFRKMDDLAIEGNRLEEQINKALYKGLPGLAEAVIAVVQRHHDRATALSEMTRRVSERVIFGDSEAALEMLKSFEQDEQTIPEEVRGEFQKALEKLRIAKKQLTKGKK